MLYLVHMEVNIPNSISEQESAKIKSLENEY